MCFVNDVNGYKRPPKSIHSYKYPLSCVKGLYVFFHTSCINCTKPLSPFYYDYRFYLSELRYIRKESLEFISPRLVIGPQFSEY